MTTLDLATETYIALSSNKTRSGLTMLGIIIGIGSVIAMLSIGQGAQNSIESSIQSIGSNLIMVMPGTQRGPGTIVSSGRGSAKSLTLDDANAIAHEVQNVLAIAPDVSGRYQVTAPGKNTNTQVIGTTAAYQSVRNISIDQGVFISDYAQKSGLKVAVLGPTVRDDLFGENADVVGQSVRINGIEFKIIGVTTSKGGSGFGSQDDMIFIPLSTAQRFLAGNEYLSTISVTAQDAQSSATVQQAINELLLTRHHIKDPTNADFSTLNQADIVSAASSVTDTFTILLGSVAGISLIVGGIGIMNMMLTTVTERMREIGLRKSVGAKRKDINIQFLAEAVSLTILGGIIGIILGWGIAAIVTYTGVIQTKVTLFSVVLAFSVSAIIGIIFGYYPARRASRLNPIDALRYE